MNHKTHTFFGRPAAIGALILILAATLLVMTTASADVGTAFTYQGQLLDGDGAVNGTCDIQFSLYDAVTDGAQVGSMVTKTNVDVNDGLFTVELDFGAGAFTGDPRWLELAVRCPAGGGEYDTLAPRQSLTPTPYAVYATHAYTATIASDVEPGVITPAHLNELPGNGTGGQLLASDGSGGFGWQDATSAPVKQLVQDFVMISGEGVSAGDVVSFLNGAAYGPSAGWGAESVFNNYTVYIAVSALSATDFVIAYSDEGNLYYGTAITGTVNGGILSWGAESVFNAGWTNYIAVSALSTTDFVIAYTDQDNSYYGTAITGTVSGGTLSWGAESVFNAAGTGNIAIGTLSATDFVVAYSDSGNSSYGTAITGTVSGGTLSWGAESVFHTAGTGGIAVSTLSATDFVVAYQDSSSVYGTAITGTVSGGTLSWGAESVFNAVWTLDIAVSALSATDFVIAYDDDGNSNYGTTITGTVSGGSLSWGTKSVFNAASTDNIAITALSATDFVIAYKDNGNSGYGTAIAGTVSGGTWSWEKESVFNAAGSSLIVASTLSATDFVVAYSDSGNSYYGTAIVGSSVGRHLIGTAKTAASGGETVTVIISGVSDVHSGLVPGQFYYLQVDGSLGPTPTLYRIGLAISESELILDQLW